MRRFNPEKELRKIQKGNKNKIILFVVLLLVVSAISYSFALYQIRYNKQIIYTTVAPFYSKDLQLAVYVDNKKQEEFPGKEDGYLYEGIECDNDDISASFDSATWKLDLKIGEPNKCNIKFTSSPFKAEICKDTPMSECLLKEEVQYNKELAYDDPDNNARYIGADPANYIWFNCDVYNAVTNSASALEQHCEKWRIIGAFKNIIIADSNVDTGNQTKQDLVKIIRDDILGGLLWNDSGQWGSNNWTNATLQTSLNNDYLSPDNGVYTSTSKPRAINSPTLGMIETVRWNIGGWNLYDNTGKEFYEKERGETTFNFQPTTWDGKIALIYPSDYGYATTGNDSGITRETCLATNLSNYNEGCYEKDWLYLSNYQWLLTPFSDYPNSIYRINPTGGLGSNGSKILGTVSPSLYLKSKVKIVGGDGSSNSPYILAP